MTCVPSDANTCVITVALTDGLDETIASTMPDSQPWYAAEYETNPAVSAQQPYEISNETWDGNPNATTGTAYTAELASTGSEASGAEAVITFKHVSSTTTPMPYKSVSISGPLSAKHGSTVTFTSVVKPKPPAGHVVLQRKRGTSWVDLATMTYAAARHAEVDVLGGKSAS